MLRFKTKAEPLWIRGTHGYFDNTELTAFTMEQRGAIRFLIAPLTSEMMRDIKAEMDVLERNEEMRTVSVNSKEEFETKILDQVLLNWEGIGNEDDEALECNLTNKLILVDKGYPKLGLAFIRIAGDLMSQYEKWDRQSKDTDIRD